MGSRLLLHVRLRPMSCLPERNTQPHRPQVSLPDQRLSHLRAKPPLPGPPRRQSTRGACATLEAGQILAFKGIGGFQLMVDAQNPQAVERLRLRKRRSSKPLAILYPDLAAIERHCQVTPSERAILSSPAAPIVLLRPRHRCASSHIGAMLPCTPPSPPAARPTPTPAHRHQRQRLW